MTKHDFLKNLKGIEDLESIPKPELEKMYD